VDVVLLKRRDLTDRLLPSGLLREPLSALERADAIVLSYQETEPFDFAFQDKPLRPDFSRASLENLRGKRVTAFAGLGDNSQFFKAVDALGLDVEERISLPDHYHYRGFRLRKDRFYLTTPKDMVKLPPAENLYALDFRLRVEGLVDFVKDKAGLAQERR